MEIYCKYDELLNPKKIKDHPKNNNKHGSDQIERLAEMYKFHGIRHPIIISKRSQYIVAGHARKLAALRAGIKEFPIVYQDFESEEKEYAFLVSDNAIALWAELDLSKIHLELPNLEPFDINMLGLKDFKLEPDPEKEKVEDEVPEVKESIVKLGDIWQLGEHRLMCGDSTGIELVLDLTLGEKIDLLLTDPPYGMNVVKPDGNIGGTRTGSIVGKSKIHKAKVGVYKPIIGDDKPFDPQHLLDLECDKIIWGANHFSDKLPCSPHWICWYKDMPEGTDFSGAELAWTNIDKKAVKTYKHTWAGMTRQGDRKDELTKRVHPTQKPVGLMAAILKDYDGDNVLDLYGGSGSTLIACEKTNRKCFMMELDEYYCTVIIKRWEQYTGRKAELLNNKEISNNGKSKR